MNFKKQNSNFVQSDPGMDTFLDILFVMLLFVFVSLNHEIPEAIPIPSAPPYSHHIVCDCRSRTISIEITDNQAVLINGDPIDPRAVKSRIVLAHAVNPGSELSLSVAQQAKLAILVKVVDAIRAAGLSTPQVLLKS